MYVNYPCKRTAIGMHSLKMVSVMGGGIGGKGRGGGGGG